MPRRSPGGLPAWFKETPTPLFVVDAARRVVFFNYGCEALTGWAAADVLGRTCLSAGDPDGEQVAALTGALCPPPAALAGSPVWQPVAVPSRDGQLRQRMGVYLPLPMSRPDHARVLGVWLPAAEQPPAANSGSTLPSELLQLRHNLRKRFGIDRIVARSPAMQRLLTQVELAAASRAAVHLCGPQGSGREFHARVIHQRSSLGARPFVPLDCAALTPLELQRVLRQCLGPAPDRDASPPESRPAGLFLRRVTALPRDVQQLLRELWPDAAQPDPTAVRVYSAAEETLEVAVAEERLQPELMYLLSPLTIAVPSLRDRAADLPLLVQLFIEEFNRSGERQVGAVAPAVMQQLLDYNWPGQVRELRAVIGEAHAAAEGPEILPEQLPFRFRTGVDAQRTMPRGGPPLVPLEQMLREVELLAIQQALDESSGNRTRAARRLGLTRPKLYRRMEQLGLADPSPAGATARPATDRPTDTGTPAANDDLPPQELD